VFAKVVIQSFNLPFSLNIGASAEATAVATFKNACYPVGPTAANLDVKLCKSVPDFFKFVLNFVKSNCPVSTFTAFDNCI
jgi:hypothetical protein